MVGPRVRPLVFFFPIRFALLFLFCSPVLPSLSLSSFHGVLESRRRRPEAAAWPSSAVLYRRLPALLRHRGALVPAAAWFASDDALPCYDLQVHLGTLSKVIESNKLRSALFLYIKNSGF